ncbi:MAG: hypothetical protein ABGY09_00830 [Euryarchaeota archaeon]
MRSWFPQAPEVDTPTIEPDEAESYLDAVRERIKAYAFGERDWKRKIRTRRAYLRRIREDEEALSAYAALLTITASGPRPAHHLVAEGEAALAEAALYEAQREGDEHDHPEERALRDLYRWDVRVLEPRLRLYAVHFTYPLLHRSPGGQRLRVVVTDDPTEALRELHSHSTLGVRLTEPADRPVYTCPRCGYTRLGRPLEPGQSVSRQRAPRTCPECRTPLVRVLSEVLDALHEPQGYLVMHFRTLARTFREDARRLTLRDLQRAPKSEELHETCLDLFPRLKRRVQRARRRAKKGGFPPCMRRLLERAQEGENLPHEARFALAAFLVNVGWDEDRIVEVFSNLPDFDEERTRYQVRHIAGKEGSGTKYLPPNCDKMREWGLCENPDGCGVKNPLTYARRGGSPKESGPDGSA